MKWRPKIPHSRTLTSIFDSNFDSDSDNSIEHSDSTDDVFPETLTLTSGHTLPALEAIPDAHTGQANHAASEEEVEQDIISIAGIIFCLRVSNAISEMIFS